MLECPGHVAEVHRRHADDGIAGQHVVGGGLQRRTPHGLDRALEVGMGGAGDDRVGQSADGVHGRVVHDQQAGHRRPR